LSAKVWGETGRDSTGKTGKLPKLKFTNDDSNLGPFLNALGAEGWELVGYGGDATRTLIFKRPRT